MKKFELIEHTADVGIKAFGETLSESFENAAKGMFEIISDSNINEVGEHHIEIKSQNIEQLLVDFLSELLYIHTVEYIMFNRCEVEINKGEFSLNANVFGENFDEKKHEITEIKAVTYHMLKVEKKDLWTVQVLFDI